MDLGVRETWVFIGCPITLPTGVTQSQRSAPGDAQAASPASVRSTLARLQALPLLPGAGLGQEHSFQPLYNKVTSL